MVCYQVLLQIRAQCNGNFCKTSEGLWRQCFVKGPVFRWFKAFSEGRGTIEDEPQSGRPSSSRTDENVDTIRDLVRSDRRLTVRMIGQELNLTHTTVHQILTNELGMRKICSKMVPKNLSQNQKDIRKERCLDLLESIENEPNFVERVITSDESWVFEYDPETKRQSMEWHRLTSPRSKKERMIKSKIKCMLICFFDVQGIVHKEFVPEGQTVNKHFYREVLERLRKRFIRVRPNIKNNWALHHDNAPCHTAISINEFLARKNIHVAPQPPYSPDLSPCDFFLSPKLKNYLKGTHFGTLQNIKTAVTDQLKAIPVSEFQHCYADWKDRLQRCVASQGSYFEGDNIKL
ncbi:histone-lysine N-methyltransferase SETMAR-like [Euwallacea similis]|uniref:histone-lysine N-methyltransferase SETMAR-like n=1 Tax=Euwallacea similis TaxID=1736056 RepID=UPI00344CFD8A